MNANAKILVIVSLALLSCAACKPAAQPDPRGLTAMVSVEGSNTMKGLVNSWGKAFMAANPNVPVSVESGDSGGGIEALIKRTTDVAAASRDLTDDEAKTIGQRGDRLAKATVARDAIVVMVNPHNPVSALSMDQLRQIFTGTKQNWHEFGGPNKNIEVFTREPESGTSSYFQQHALNGQPYAATAKILRSSDALSAEVQNSPWSIAYDGLGYGLSAGAAIKLLKIKLTDTSPAIAPNRATAVGAYPFSRPLIMFFDKDAKPSVRQFVDFCMSKQGQDLVEAQGYARVK